MLSLAKFKKTLHSLTHSRVRRSLDNIDIVYPSDSPITDPPTTSTEIKSPTFIVSNDVSIVYPQSYNPNRDGRQGSFSSAVNIYKPAATILPVSDLTASSMSTSMTLSSTSTIPSFHINQSLDQTQYFDPTTADISETQQPTTLTTRSPSEQTTGIYSEETIIQSEENYGNEKESNNEKFSDDYEDWGVVVSVVKSVSESDSSVKLIQQQETTPTVEYQETTTSWEEQTTTIPQQQSDNVTLKPKALPFKSNLHPFRAANDIRKSNSTFGHHKIHPFLHQIKSPIQATTKGFTDLHLNVTLNNATTVVTTPSTASTLATGLFQRFSFLNKGKGKRPDFNPKSQQSSTSTDSTPPSQSSFSSLPKFKSLSSRLAGFKRPSFRPSNLKKSSPKEHEDISNEIEDTNKPKTTKSTFSFKKSNFLNRFKSKNTLLRTSTSNQDSNSFKDSSKLVDKPRPKRLPSPFGGSRPESLFKPRPSHRLFGQSPATPRTEVSLSTSTEKQTVGDIIKQLNGDTEEEAKPATLRPHSFKPKFGVSSKIREQLLAELAEVKDDTESSKEVSVASTESSPRTSSSVQIPKRLSSLSRKHLSPLSSGNTRLRSRNKLRPTGSDSIKTNGGSNDLTESSLSGKLGVTVVSPPRANHVAEARVTHDSLGTEVDIVHDRETLTTKELENSSTDSPFQVLLEGSNDNIDADLMGDEDHDDHVHDLVHEHHPEIHFRHLNPDVLPTASLDTVNTADTDSSPAMFLPTMPAHVDSDKSLEDGGTSVPEATAASFLPTVDENKVTEAAEARTVARSRGRSRYRARTSPSRSSGSSGSSRPAIAEQRRVQIRRRNRVEIARDNTETEGEQSESKSPASDGRRVLPQRQRFRSRSRSAQAEADKSSTSSASGSSRFTNPRRLRSRARARPASSSNQKTPEVRAPGRTRGRGRLISRTTTEREPEVETELKETSVTENSVTVTDIEDKQEQILEGKFTTVEIATTTEGVVTTLTINDNNEENSEFDQETTQQVSTEEISTLRPGKFKPKYGSDTRNKLREALRQELLANKTAAAGTPRSPRAIEDGILSKLEAIDNGQDQQPLYDTEFSDFDIDPTIVEAPTTAIISLEDEDYYFSSSRPQSRTTRKISEHTGQDYVAGGIQRRNRPRRKNSKNPLRRNKIDKGIGLLRSGRSTLGDIQITSEGVTESASNSFENLTDAKIVEDQTKSIPTPFLLKGGKGYKKDLENNLVDNKFSSFRSGNKSIKRRDDIYHNSRKNQKKLKKKYLFGEKPSVEKQATENIKNNIYLDLDFSSSTFAPNTLTTNEAENSRKEFLLKKQLKKKLRLKKVPKKTTSPPPLEDLLLKTLLSSKV